MLITLAILVITGGISFTAFKNAKLMDDLILSPPAVHRRREYYRLVSYGLVHADLGHLLFNMLTLFFFGRVLESFFISVFGGTGWVLYALLYVGGLLASILPSYYQHRNDSRYRSLGASGAVSAVLFGTILLSPWAQIYVYFVRVPAIIYAVLYVLYSIYMDRSGRDNVNHSAHLWGAAFGVAFTVVAYPPVISLFLTQLARPHF